MQLFVLFLATLVSLGIGMIGHELAHAIAARLLRIDVTAIELGKGRRLLGWRWGEVEWSVGAQLNAGCVTVNLPRGQGARWRYLLMTAAGPAYDLVAALAGVAVILTWAESDGWRKLLFVERTQLSLALGWTMAHVISFWDVFDRDDTLTIGLPAAGDGPKIRTLLGHPSELYEYWCAQATAYGRLGNQLAATEETGPEIVLEERVVALAEFAAVEEAKLGLIRAYAVGSVSRRSQTDDMCTTALMSGDREFMRRCVPWAEELVQSKPGEWTYVGTLGSLLLATGRMQEGAVMLEKLMESDESRLDRAIAACCLAWAAHRTGNEEARERWWQQAMRCNAGKPAVPWMGRDLNRGAGAVA